MWPCTLKSDEEKSTYAGLAQEIGFSPAHLLGLLRLVKNLAKLCTACNKYDLIFSPCFWLANHNDFAGGLILVVPTYLQSMFQFMGGIAKKVNN
jgi:hypothetical protein